MPEDKKQSSTSVGKEGEGAAAPKAPSFLKGEAANLSMKDRLGETEKILKHYSLWAGGLGVIPIPVVDLAAVTGVQLKMLNKLTKFYGLEDDAKLGKKVISSLIGGLIPSTLGPVVGSVLKVVPVVGTLASLLMQPAFSYAATYAIGKVFIRHFEQGGTLLTLDPKKEIDYQKAMFEFALAEKKP